MDNREAIAAERAARYPDVAVGSTEAYRPAQGLKRAGTGYPPARRRCGPNTERSAGRVFRRACGGTGTRCGSAR